jgi:DNA-binding beta-propeller fold protein YncE
MKKLLTLALVAAAVFAAEGYKVVNKMKIGGTGGWDYLVFDPSSDRVFASHGNQVEVVDTKTGKVVGQVTDTPGVHGIAIAPELNKGFISSRGKNAAIIFDLKTLQKTGEAKAGNNPDAICYEPKTKRVVAVNHSGKDATIIDAKTGDVVGTVETGEAGEYCAADGTGKMYVNMEGTSEVVEIDVAKPAVTRRVTIEPGCKGPSGLAIDTKDHVVFAVCGDTKTMAIVDYTDMKLVGTAPIGAGPDAAGYDPGTGLAFSSNGQSGDLTIVKKVSGKWEAVDTVETGRGARTMTVNDKTHQVYLLAAEYGPAPAAKEGQKAGRPPVLPDSFQILVVGKP